MAYDPTGTGRVSLAAWIEHDWQVALLRYDVDKDGHIREAEYISKFCDEVWSGLKVAASRCPDDAGVLFSTLDQNHDGELSRAEIEVQSERLFRQNDRDHDGFITAQEMRDTANGR